MTGPLDGIRIIEIANVVAGPSAAAQLADQGADVIKIEPPSGDIIRKSSKTGLPKSFGLLLSAPFLFTAFMPLFPEPHIK